MPSYPIQLKRNGTAAATPSSLLHGEVALNYADGKLFWKDASNVIQSFTFQAYALSSHTHAASDITSGTLDAARIANDSITYAKLQNVSATDRLLGRSSAGAGDVEEVTCTAAGRALLSGADAAAQRSTLSVQPTASPAFTGTVSAAAANFTGAVSVTSPLTLTGTVAGNVRQIKLQTSGVDRWQITPGFDAESGSNAGSTLWITRWSDAGAFLGTPIAISRATGSVTLENPLFVQAGSGSAGSYKPGIAVSGDDDTGLQQVGGANTISLVTQGSERVRVDASGNVGIGASPSFRLDVLGSANCVAKIKTSAAGSFGCLQIHNANTNGETSIGFRDDSDSDASSWVIGKSVGGVADAFGFYYNGNRAIIESDGVVKLPDVYEDTVGATNRDLFIDNAGKLGYVSSIRASKTNIAAIDDVSWLRDLTPVSFHYRKRNDDGTYSDEPDGTLDYGLIAEEVEPVAPEMCFYDVVDGEPQLRGVHYSKLITPMLRYIQQLEQRIAALEERLNHA